MKPIILLMHGPNLNFLGKRDPTQYGTLTLKDIEWLCKQEADKKGYAIHTYQSNHEGFLIDTLQQEASRAAGIIINPGALTHYSYALYDALLDTKRPIIEVHLSDITQRESFRSHSVTAPACLRVISGKREKGYIEAIELLVEHLQS